MTDAINLNKARKAKARTAAKGLAIENRAKFGQAKAQRNLRDALADKARKSLDGAKREP